MDREAWWAIIWGQNREKRGKGGELTRHRNGNTRDPEHWKKHSAPFTGREMQFTFTPRYHFHLSDGLTLIPCYIKKDV